MKKIIASFLMIGLFGILVFCISKMNIGQYTKECTVISVENGEIQFFDNKTGDVFVWETNNPTVKKNDIVLVTFDDNGTDFTREDDKIIKFSKK